ncbi:hypothetical protein [Streptomyces sp. NPDC051173]|uniref:hypothetical protein n=1 Tax=Streptomyces sp. NPDC051173 TaxID=3155164 RepID=UPI00344F74F7
MKVTDRSPLQPTPRTVPVSTPGARRGRRAIARHHLAAARTATRALGYRTLSGNIAADVTNGRLTRTGDFLDRIGGSDLPDGQKSWFGRHVAKAFRTAHDGADAIRVWAQHRTTSHWVHVHVYNPTDPALYTALQTYKATRHLAAADFTECA